MNYREKMRKAVECPQFGNINYGEWGTLNLNQRKDIKRLLDEMDRADEVIKNQFFKIERLNNIINELEKDLEEVFDKMKEKQVEIGGRGYYYTDLIPIENILDKLKELKEGK